jgi:hypothetical protein
MHNLQAARQLLFLQSEFAANGDVPLWMNRNFLD